MTNKEDLEKKASFRIAKVFFIFSALVVFGITLAIWGGSASKTFDASNAFAICNSKPSERVALTEAEKNSLELNYGSKLNADGRIRVNKECNRNYESEKNLESVPKSDMDRIAISLEAFAADPIYKIQGVKEGKDYNFGYLLLVILIESGIFFALMKTGLYVFGGKEASNPKNS